MPSLIIAGNWKMNTTVAEAGRLAQAIATRVGHASAPSVVLCPPFVSLTVVSEAVRGSHVAVGAQNVHPAGSGAFTGEVSAPMLAETCSHVIIGHSERRALFGESDTFVNEKVLAAFDAGLTPILCVGEQLDDREAGRANRVVEAQVRGGLTGVDSPKKLIVAYEPVWAIGTGRAATPEIAQAVMSHIRGVLGDMFGQQAASDVPLLYGGSANPSNIAGYMAQSDVNGALVGGAALDADLFCQMVELVSRAG
ncbi:MAG: triose-phosphate isomerase [SAR202 cluster bacterium]|nr:triose-phosphate isomerase [SAR202 cluster bacterium]MDP6665006.1 triose-phosphate isomerase [SAR202 cluster bacterium]MDP6798615.1 triose-phosphate isomerase [SAR202 cluster bacterium]MQG57682.1 triose-phosphate isomerase [SAR202 cluster bacterium]MQG69846.1 triose-phosphate isomerase [SAR202 cluster bacterium]